MNSKKNIAICIPSGRFVDFGFFKSFSNAIAKAMLMWNVAVIPVASPMIFANRNEILRKAFRIEETTPNFLLDYLVWLDNDIVFSFDDLKRLVSHLDSGKEFVSGVYYNPVGKDILPVAYRKSGERYEWLKESDLNGLIEVDAIGFGFCAMKADVARRVAEKFNPRPFDLRHLDDGGLITEDQVFCERAKELGCRITLDSELIVKHAKGYLPR